MNYVTNGRHSVGGMSGCGIVGYVFSAKIHQRINGRTIMRPGDGDGRVFADRDEADAYAREHGYVRRYDRRQWCPHCRRLHMRWSSGEGRAESWTPTQWCPVRGMLVSKLESEIEGVFP